jgi:hypothetical protein
VLHGLRKCAARKLAEAGCSEGEISITGLKTTRMVEECTRDASKKKQASAAILKLERGCTRVMSAKERAGAPIRQSRCVQSLERSSIRKRWPSRDGVRSRRS